MSINMFISKYRKTKYDAMFAQLEAGGLQYSGLQREAQAIS
ncbi:hypothetical protein [Stutzerimonas nitrititolerans]|nr:hypothetical protein [Stutzerimonas nitrititolerans]